MKRVTQKTIKIVGHGTGPQFYAGELISTFYDGTCITATFGALNMQVTEKYTPPIEMSVINVSGTIVLTPAAAAATIKALTGLLNAMSDDNQKRRRGPAVK